MDNGIDISEGAIKDFKKVFPEALLKKLDNGGIHIPSSEVERLKKTSTESLESSLKILNGNNIFLRAGNIVWLKTLRDILNHGENGKDAYRSLIGSGNSISIVATHAVEIFYSSIAPLIGRSMIGNNIENVNKAIKDEYNLAKDIQKIATIGAEKAPEVSSPSI